MAGPKTYSPEFVESLRTQSFEFHPEIAQQAAPLPRRADGADYVAPGDEPAAAESDD